MATIPTNAYGVKYLNNLPEYGNTFGIPLVSELTMFINAVTLDPGEVVYAARFAIYQANETYLYSPEIPYNGVGEVSYNFGKIQKNWVSTQAESHTYIAILCEVRTSKPSYGNYYYHGWFGYGSQILNYNLPLITAYNATRSLTVSTAADYSLNCSVSELSTDPTLKNLLKYKFQYLNGIWIDAYPLVTAPGVMNNSVFNHSLPYIESQSYQTRVLIQDKFNTVYAYDVLPTALVPLSVGKYGVGIGKIIENEDAALDMEGPFYRNNIKQPKVFMKKPTDPDPDGMEDGDLLIIYNDMVAFSSSNFPQEFGTGIVWGQVGAWPTDFLYWTSMASTSNALIESFEASMFKGGSYPSSMFNNDSNYAEGYFIPVFASPATVIMKFKGKISFNSFTLEGWGQDHEPLNSPKSFAFFGSNDGHTWTPLYDTVAFTNTWKTSATAAMDNSGMQFEYLKMVWRTNQADNNASVATLICVKELKFNVTGYKYV